MDQALKIEAIIRCRGKVEPDGSLLFTTDWLRKKLNCSENELELVALKNGQYLAYNALGAGRGLLVNSVASTRLRSRYKGPLTIYGDAVSLSAV